MGGWDLGDATKCGGVRLVGQGERGEQQEKTAVRTLLIGWRNKEAAGRGWAQGVGTVSRVQLQYIVTLKDIYFNAFLATA